ncbi:exosome 3'-_5 exonuclease subunit ski4 (Csl4) [Bachmanniomyces sp. S44760]|nr:exosome 3'->5 exonuclease subunit ski4 (Csl4) [Bachmanniomyces sp. S44760]
MTVEMSSQPPQLPSFAFPGLAIGSTKKHISGPGTHVTSSSPSDNSIYASLAGKPAISTLTTKPSSSNSSLSSPSKIPKIQSVLSIKRGRRAGPRLPEVGSICLCRVVRLQVRQVTVQIVVIGEKGREEGVGREQGGGGGEEIEDHVVPEGADFQGIIRREDIRAMEKDKVKVEESFRVGDLVRGEVISLGDQSNYYLTTAHNSLGVIMATNEKSGNLMFPISWREFRDPVSGENEARKVAKPF